MAPIVVAPIAAEAVLLGAGTTATGLALWYNATTDEERKAAVRQILRGFEQLGEAETYKQALRNSSAEAIRPTLKLFVALSHSRLLEGHLPTDKSPSPAEVAKVLAGIARRSGDIGSPPPKLEPPKKPGGFEPNNLLKEILILTAIGLYKLAKSTESFSNTKPDPKLPEVPVRNFQSLNNLPKDGLTCFPSLKEFPKIQLKRGLTYLPSDPDVMKILRDFHEGKGLVTKLEPAKPRTNELTSKELPTISASTGDRKSEADKIISLLRKTSAGEGVRTRDDLAKYLGYHPKTFFGILSGKLNVENIEPFRAKLETALGAETADKINYDVFRLTPSGVAQLSEVRRGVIERIREYVKSRPSHEGEVAHPVKTNEDIAKLLGLQVKTISSYIAGRDHFSEERLIHTRSNLEMNVPGIDQRILDDLKSFQKPSAIALRPPAQVHSDIRNRAVKLRHETVEEIGNALIALSPDGKISNKDLNEIFSFPGRTIAALLRGTEDLGVDAVWQIERRLKSVLGAKEASRIDLECFRNPEAPLRSYLSIRRTEAIHKIAEALLPEEMLQPITKIRKELAERLGLLEQLLSKVSSGELDLPRSKYDAIVEQLKESVPNIGELLWPLTKDGSQSLRVPNPLPQNPNLVGLGPEGLGSLIAQSLETIAQRALALGRISSTSNDELERYLGLTHIPRYLKGESQLHPSSAARIIKQVKHDIPDIEEILLPLGQRYRTEMFDGSGRAEALKSLTDALIRYEVIQYALPDKVAESLGLSPSRFQRMVDNDDSMLTPGTINSIVERLEQRIPNIEELLLPLGTRTPEGLWSGNAKGGQMMTLAKALHEAKLITHINNNEVGRALELPPAMIHTLSRGGTLEDEAYFNILRILKPAVSNAEYLLSPWRKVRDIRTPRRGIYDLDTPPRKRKVDPHLQSIIEKIKRDGYFYPEE